MESLLGEEEVSSLETIVPVHVESPLAEEEVSSLETIIAVRKGITFDPTVGSPSNF